jgi:hypothetical protein
MAKSGVIRIDFSKEEEGGGGGRIPTTWKKGDYHVRILGAKTGRSPEKDTPFVEVKFKVLEGRRKGSTFSERLYITPKSLKRIRLLLEAIGVKVPKSAVNLPLNKLKGKDLWVELELQEKEGYDPKMAIAFEGFMSEDDYEESDDEDEDDEDEDDDEDDDDEDEDEDDEDDEDEDDDDEDDDDDDDEEEEVKPKRRARKSRTRTKKAPAKKTRKKKDDIEDLDLDDL